MFWGLLHCLLSDEDQALGCHFAIPQGWGAMPMATPKKITIPRIAGFKKKGSEEHFLGGVKLSRYSQYTKNTHNKQQKSSLPQQVAPFRWVLRVDPWGHHWACWRCILTGRKGATYSWWTLAALISFRYRLIHLWNFQHLSWTSWNVDLEWMFWT